MKSSFRFVASICLFVLLSCATGRAQSKQPNVLFIPIDDLNHWVGHLGRHPQTKTPHMDRLANMGVSFNKAYCAAPACNPSRIALMSGLRPSTTGCYDNSQDWRPTVSEDKLLNKTLLDAGYQCFGTGKILHGSYGNSSKWTEFHKTNSGNMSRHPSAPNDGVGGIKFSPLGNQDEDMPDYDAVSYGIEVLTRKHDKPFFLAVGLVKPHMPFSVPKKWFDLFPLDSIELPPHRDGDLDDVPAAGVRMAKPAGDHAAILQSGRWKEAVQAYLATIAFCDAQVGRLLEALEKSDYRDNTIICLWSDHGWSLGEKEHWRKFALWEEPTRTVFIWKVPGMTPAGIQSPRPVDYMSIYPTLCALTSVKKPAHVEGVDISSLLKNPTAQWDSPALTTFHKDNHSFRSEQWRYIRYDDGSEELYNHEADPFEWTNVAGDPEYAAVKAGFTSHIPSVNAPELPNVGSGNAKAAKTTPAKKKKAKGQDPKPLRVLLITGGCCHDYAVQKDLLKAGLEARAHVIVDQVHSDDKSTNPPLAIFGNADYAKGYDVVIHDECAAATSDPATIAGVLAPHRAGIPGVNLHCAMHSYRIGPPAQPAEAGSERAMWFEYLGIQSSAHGPKLPIPVTTLNEQHAIISGLGWRNWTTIDEELYNNIQLLKTATSLQHGTQDVKQKDGSMKKADAVVTWVNDYNGTRVFNTTLGHYNETVADARYLDLVARGMLWACGKLDDQYLKPGSHPSLPVPAATPSSDATPKKRGKKQADKAGATTESKAVVPCCGAAASSTVVVVAG